MASPNFCRRFAASATHCGWRNDGQDVGRTQAHHLVLGSSAGCAGAIRRRLRTAAGGMMARMSVGLRLTIWYSAVLLVALALFGFLTWIALDHWLMRGVDERLAQKVQGMRTVLEVEGVTDRHVLQQELSEFAEEGPDGRLIQIRDSRGLLEIGRASCR